MGCPISHTENFLAANSDKAHLVLCGSFEDIPSERDSRVGTTSSPQIFRICLRNYHLQSRQSDRSGVGRLNFSAICQAAMRPDEQRVSRFGLQARKRDRVEFRSGRSYHHGGIFVAQSVRISAAIRRVPRG